MIHLWLLSFCESRRCRTKTNKYVGRLIHVSLQESLVFFIRLKANTVRPGFDSTRQTLPPCSSATRRAKVSPKPVPLDFPAVTKGLNKVLRIQAGIPGPLSEIATQICSSTCLT